MNWLADFHFLRPLWLLALPALLYWLYRQRHRLSQHSAWSQVIDPALLPHLLQDNRTSQPTRALFPMAVLAAVLLVGALAGPSWRELPQPVFDAPLHRVLVMDLSPAMDAQDIKPSRLKRAQLLAQQLLDQQTEGDTALVAFAADAFPVVPLTSDRGTVSHLLHSLSTDIMPAAGNNLAAGIREAQDLLQQAGAVGGDIVLLTASPASTAVRAAADEARSAGFRLNVLGAGTTQGAPVPVAGGWRKDAQGSIQLARLDESGLRQLAQQHAGHYQRIDQTDAAFELTMNRLDRTGGQQQEQDFHADQWQDEGPWLLLPLLIIAALAFRRGWLMLLMLCLPLSVPQPAYAGWWKTNDQQAFQQYQDGAYEQAAATFNNHNWRASALYQQGQYDEAAKLWAQDDSAQSAYNRGNALARAGDLEAAIQAYAEALTRDPQLADAQANKALLEKLKQQQEQQQQNQDSSEQSQDQDQKSESEQDGDSQSSQNDGQPQDQQDPSQQDAEQQNAQDQQQAEQQQDQAEANQADEQPAQQSDTPTDDDDQPPAAAQADAEQQQADEQAQAVQQWLKRIPDDPGGLLRRKFQRMEQRRQDAPR